jgi:hypothetical protein
VDTEAEMRGLSLFERSQIVVPMNPLLGDYMKTGHIKYMEELEALRK